MTTGAEPTAAARITVDGNEAVARVAYRLSEVIAIYPITPASPMGEWADVAQAEGRPNLWGAVPAVVELQSEAGAAGSVHGALQRGALTTTFTASQGLLLMVPNLYKLAGELTPAVLHVAARALAAPGLSIFGDHSDVMACRGTGCAILIAASPQEAADFAAIALRASLCGRLPFLNVMDGFRTSHEIRSQEAIPDPVLLAMVPADQVAAHRARALSPDHPVLRGASYNPDLYFQAREAVNPFHEALPGHLLEAMDRFAALTGRRYQPFEYEGDERAERLVLLMGSACETAAETVVVLQAAAERVGVLKVRLFRPFSARLLVEALPASLRAVAVLDRCKEPGAGGEPLYLDVVAALAEEWTACHPDRPLPLVLGGRYGLASKEFTPAMVKAVFDHLAAALAGEGGRRPLNHFSVGIADDLSHRSLPIDPDFVIEAPDEERAVFYGLGSDGTVGGNRSTIRIIGEQTDRHAQGYFVYDSKKAGSVTVSHLRFGPRPIRSPYLIQRPTLVACHQWDFIGRFDLLDGLQPGGLLLLNSPYDPAGSWQRLPAAMRQRIAALQLRVWLIDAAAVAERVGLGPHINTVMQACFFAVSAVLPRRPALAQLRRSISDRFARHGEAVVAMNLRALEAGLEALQPLDWSAMPGLDPAAAASLAAASGWEERLQLAPALVREVIGPQLQRRGDQLPVSAMPCDGTWPLGTARWEKRSIAAVLPVWQDDLCVQCGRCVMVCPHAAIRAKVVEPEALAAAPAHFRQAPARDHAFAGQAFTIQVAVDDCTGCELCVAVCPARDRRQPSRKALVMAPQRPLRQQGRLHWDFFLALPEQPRAGLDRRRLSQQQLQQPLFEFSGACAGCGETPYLKLASQLFGDRMLIANATGCSSIYGGNLPTTPWSTNAEGRGPAWSNSLFEDNAEFGYGMRVALDQQRRMALDLLARLAASLPAALVEGLLRADQDDEAGIQEQRQRVQELERRLRAMDGAEDPASLPARLLQLTEVLVRKSVWLVGGDGWAYDIGFGGLDHVLASGGDINTLVLDTEVYSNTGGQMSKATPLGAVAKFAAAGKAAPKKDLGLMAMTYGNVYVASVAMGARDEHTIRAFLEAESYPGPSLIIAYSHCIAHGIVMAQGMAQQRAAVDSGRWLLYRYDPRRRQQGLNPLQLDCQAPRRSLAEAMAAEQRFRLLASTDPERAGLLQRQAEAERRRRWATYSALAAMAADPEPDSTAPTGAERG